MTNYREVSKTKQFSKKKGKNLKNQKTLDVDD